MKKNNQISRAESLIKSDRLSLKHDFLNLFTQDLQAVLNEYFDCLGSPKIEVCKAGNEYLVTVTSVAGNIKFFNNVPIS